MHGVFIRPPRASDEAEFLAMRRANREWLEPWEPLASPGQDLFGPDGYANWLATATTPTRRRFFICTSARGGAAWSEGHAEARIVGQASLGAIARGPLQQAFLGYWIAREHAGQGIMTAALPLVLAHAFRDLGLHRVEANIQPHNAASIALVTRLGFRREGFSPGYLEIQGRWADHERWAMLADEFVERYPRIVSGL